MLTMLCPTRTLLHIAEPRLLYERGIFVTRAAMSIDHLPDDEAEQESAENAEEDEATEGY